MGYTLGQASNATGRSKSTIQAAIKSGRISAQKDDIGQWSIDPAELHRVFAVSVPNTHKSNDAEPTQNTELLIENAKLKARLEAMGELKDQIEAERENLREQNTRISALLTAPKADPYAAILERLEAIEREKVVEKAPIVEQQHNGFWKRFVG